VGCKEGQGSKDSAGEPSASVSLAIRGEGKGAGKKVGRALQGVPASEEYALPPTGERHGPLLQGGLLCT